MRDNAGRQGRVTFPSHCLGSRSGLKIMRSMVFTLRRSFATRRNILEKCRKVRLPLYDAFMPAGVVLWRKIVKWNRVFKEII
jgi:hypothetical protein